MSRGEFFRRPETRRAIETFGRAQDVVLFVGAGVSSSQGLPTWRELLWDLLAGSAERDERLTPPDLREAYVRTLLETFDHTYLGSLVKARYGESLRESLRHELYYRRRYSGGVRRGVGPNFAASVCQLILTRQIAGKRTLVLTTNYDDVLETLLRKDPGLLSLLRAAGYRRVESCVGLPTDDDPEALRVFHLHGFVAQAEDQDLDSEIVLSAKDYGVPWSNHWSFQILRDDWHHPWLFVGISFIDPHITSYLAERMIRIGDVARLRARAIGIFSLQGRSWSALPAEIRPSLVDAEVDRFAELGMTVLPTDFYFEDAQLLRQICLCIKESYPQSYIARLETWGRRFHSKRLRSRRRDEIRRFGGNVAELLHDIRSRVESFAVNPEHEHFKVELWARDVEREALFQVGSSEFVHRDPSRARRFRLTTDPLAPAVVNALATGNPVTVPRPIDQTYSRWQSFFAAPIYLPERPWFDLPVGALVIASTHPVEGPTSTLVARDASLRDLLEEWLPTLCEALNPDETFEYPRLKHRRARRKTRSIPSQTTERRPMR